MHILAFTLAQDHRLYRTASWWQNCPVVKGGSWRDEGREFQLTGPETVKLHRVP